MNKARGFFRGTSPESGVDHKGEAALRKVRGQTVVLLALSILVLIGLVGLAVDGGSMYANRRNAQNSADAAALAGAQVMLARYNTMVLDNAYDVPGSAQDDSDINTAITSYASSHGISRSDLQAYYINDDKQLVSNTQVGSTNSVPWDQGAKGIVVKNRSQSNSFFMKIFGWNTVGASANSTAFMGIAVDSGTGVPIAPIGLFTNTLTLNSLVFGQEYTLIDSDITDTIGSGNWGYVDFNGNGSSNVVKAWLDCGFNPTINTSTQWSQWCTVNGSSNAGQAVGPTKHYECADLPDCTAPADNPTYVPFIKWGATYLGDPTPGWWLGGQSGTTMSNCHDLSTLVDTIGGQEFMIPVFDHWITAGGSNSRFHLARLAKFRITDANVDCHPNQGDEHWYIHGIYENFFIGGATGRHGDVRHTSAQTVFLDN